MWILTNHWITLAKLQYDQRSIVLSSYDEDYHHECRNRNSSPRGRGNDAMSRAFNQISRSPFTRKIEGEKLPRQFTQPTFTIYNGWTDPVAMRWFDGLRARSISSFKELTQTFGSHFITCSRAPHSLASLLSLSMREGETLKTYSDQY